MDPNEAAIRLAQRQGGLISRAQVYRLGMNSRSLARRRKAGQWRPYGREVFRLPGTPAC